MEKRSAAAPTTQTPESQPQFTSQNTSSSVQENKSNKFIIAAFVLLLLIVSGVTGYFTYQNYQHKVKKPATAKKGETPSTQPSQSEEIINVIQNAVGNAKLMFPKNAFNGRATFETDMSMSGYPEDFWQAGASIVVHLVEWIPSPDYPYSEFKILKPLTLEMKYEGQNINKHLDKNKVTIYYNNRVDEQDAWEPILTTLDTKQKTATAKVDKIGEYRLLAPFICQNDRFEPDEISYMHALLIVPPSRRDVPNNPKYGEKIPLRFDISEDWDWFHLDAKRGKTYIIETFNLSEGVDTIITLLQKDEVTEFTSNDNYNTSSLASRIVWTLPETYPEGHAILIRISQAPGSSYGCNATYSFSVVEK